MKFNRYQLDFLGAESGSWSFVTVREFKDSQITIDGTEANTFSSVFGKAGIHVGGARASEGKSKKSFEIYPSRKEAELNLVSPKPNRPELRLYLSLRAGYKPASNSGQALFWGGGYLLPKATTTASNSRVICVRVN